ncbi:MAG: rhodanese-like domain-containing protein [Pseudomonadota bacterium]
MARLHDFQSLATTVMAWTWARCEAGRITPDEARIRQQEGSLVLIDIRRPSEWRASGVPDGAVKLDATSPDFVARLMDLQRQSPDSRLALISAAAGRSTWLVRRLRKAGMENVFNVVEGLFGSPEGPGWVGRGFPLMPFAAANPCAR